MSQPVLEDMYKDCHVASLAELRKLLEVHATLGATHDPIAEIWALKELQWDLDHLEMEIDHWGVR